MRICRESNSEQVEIDPRLEEFNQAYADIGTGAAYGYLPIGSAGYLSGTMQNEPAASKSGVPLDGLFLALLDPSPGAVAAPRETPPPPPPAETMPVPAAINMPAGGSGFRTWFRQAITARMVR